jgi:hypothetical protein
MHERPVRYIELTLLFKLDRCRVDDLPNGLARFENLLERHLHSGLRNKNGSQDLVASNGSREGLADRLEIAPYVEVQDGISHLSGPDCGLLGG